MTNTDDLKEQYRNDPKFHNVVDLIYALMDQQQLTVTDIRDAAFLAAIKFEAYHVKDRFVFDRGNFLGTGEST